MLFRDGSWTNGKKRVVGRWLYLRHRERFIVELSTGRRFEVSGDTPEWGNWILEKERKEPK